MFVYSAGCFGESPVDLTASEWFQERYYDALLEEAIEARVDVDDLDEALRRLLEREESSIPRHRSGILFPEEKPVIGSRFYRKVGDHSRRQEFVAGNGYIPYLVARRKARKSRESYRDDLAHGLHLSGE